MELLAGRRPASPLKGLKARMCEEAKRANGSKADAARATGVHVGVLQGRGRAGTWRRLAPWGSCGNREVRARRPPEACWPAREIERGRALPWCGGSGRGHGWPCGLQMAGRRPVGNGVCLKPSHVALSRVVAEDTLVGAVSPGARAGRGDGTEEVAGSPASRALLARPRNQVLCRVLL